MHTKIDLTGLDDNDHVKCLGDSEWRTVRDLRTNSVQENAAEDCSPPDPYEQGLEKLRDATATDASRFEDNYKTERFRALEREHAAIQTQSDADPFPRLTAAELAEYRAPDPYKAGLDKLRSKTERDRERLFAGQRGKR